MRTVLWFKSAETIWCNEWYACYECYDLAENVTAPKVEWVSNRKILAVLN